MKKLTRIIVQIIVSEYNDTGDLIDEQVSPQMMIYRAKTPDVWAHLEQLRAGDAK